MQTTEPEEAVNVAKEHMVHDDSANPELYVPTGHAAQSDAESCAAALVPASERYLPGVHITQAVDPAEGA